MIENSIFIDYVKKFGDLFQETAFDSQKAQELKVELDALDKNEAVDNWVELLKYQVPVEKVSENKYEVYDVMNFLDETANASGDYIHVVELEESETTSSVFMKFYFVLYCLTKAIKSNEYKIEFGSKDIKV
jgi:hypothetical protein